MKNNDIICFRIALSAVNMELTDYDNRTALHVSSAEGNRLKNVFYVSPLPLKSLGSVRIFDKYTLSARMH